MNLHIDPPTSPRSLNPLLRRHSAGSTQTASFRSHLALPANGQSPGNPSRRLSMPSKIGAGFPRRRASLEYHV